MRRTVPSPVMESPMFRMTTIQLVVNHVLRRNQASNTKTIMYYNILNIDRVIVEYNHSQLIIVKCLQLPMELSYKCTVGTHKTINVKTKLSLDPIVPVTEFCLKLFLYIY